MVSNKYDDNMYIAIRAMVVKNTAVVAGMLFVHKPIMNKAAAPFIPINRLMKIADLRIFFSIL